MWHNIYLFVFISVQNSNSRITFNDITIETKKDDIVVFASSKEYPLAIPVIINHGTIRNSIDTISEDGNEWIVSSNVSQVIVIRMYILNASKLPTPI